MLKKSNIHLIISSANPSHINDEPQFEKNMVNLIHSFNKIVGMELDSKAMKLIQCRHLVHLQC